MTQNMGDHLLPRCLGAGAAVEEGLGPALHVGIGQRVGSAVLPTTGTHCVPAGFGQRHSIMSCPLSSATGALGCFVKIL